MILILSVLGFFLTTTTFDVVTSEFPSIRTIRQIHELGLNDPKNFGDVHNGVFKNVVDKYHQAGRIPNNKQEILQDVKMSLVDLYPGNEAHRQMVDDVMEDALDKVVSVDYLKDVPYPEHMDDESADLFDQAFDYIGRLREDNLSETLEALEDLQNQAERNSKARYVSSTTTTTKNTPFEQFRTVAALSVARSSTELWHGMMYGQDAHSRTLRQLRFGDDVVRSRALQEEEEEFEECSNWIINADVIAFFIITVPGTVLSWMFIIPFLLPILIPTLGLASPLVILLMIPILLTFAVISAVFSAVGWLLGFFEDECANTDAPATSPPTNSTIMY